MEKWMEQWTDARGAGWIPDNSRQEVVEWYIRDKEDVREIELDGAEKKRKDGETRVELSRRSPALALRLFCLFCSLITGDFWIVLHLDGTPHCSDGAGLGILAGAGYGACPTCMARPRTEGAQREPSQPGRHRAR